MIALDFALALLVGLSLGLLGGGGSILTVPILVYASGYGIKTAVAMSLPVVGTTSLVGAIGHWRAGNVRLRTAIAFGAVAMVAAFGGARLAAFVSPEVQMTLFAIVMLAAAIGMLRPRADADPDAPPARIPRSLLLVAAGVGLLTGLVGVGGGFLVVPALVLLAKVPMKQAVGTSLVVIAMNAAAGTAGYAGQLDMPWAFALGFTAFAIVGILGGTRLTRVVAPRTLRTGFAVLLLVMGTVILLQHFGGLLT